MRIHVPIGAGELFDRITILRIKRERLGDARRRANVERELAALERARDESVADADGLDDLVGALSSVNLELWEVEDALRLHEAEEDFGASFVSRARSVYALNDRRAALKREIDELLGSEIVEEKSYGEAADAG